MIGPRNIRSKLLVVVMGCLSLIALSASPASANLEFTHVGAALKEKDGSFSRQAGAHPDFFFNVDLPNDVPEAVRSIDLDLPKGMVGNPTPFEECTLGEMINGGTGPSLCGLGAQVGVAHILVPISPTTSEVIDVGIYNLAHGPDVPARFGFKYTFAVATITPRVRPGDYGISSGSFNIVQTKPIQEVHLRFWGVPADHSHDFERQGPGTRQIIPPDEPIIDPAPLLPFWINPTSCLDDAQGFTVRGDSWEHPEVFDERTLFADEEGTPFLWEGCENLVFDPSMTPKPGTHRAHSPTGLDVDFDVPSNEGPEGFSASVPDRQAARLLDNAGPGRLVTFFNWGEYAIWHWGPRLKVSMDGRRETIYSAKTLAEHQDVLDGDTRGTAKLDAWKAEYVWLPASSTRTKTWLEQHGYRIEFEDAESFVAVRADLPPLRPAAPPRRSEGCFPG